MTSTKNALKKNHSWISSIIITQIVQDIAKSKDLFVPIFFSFCDFHKCFLDLLANWLTVIFGH